MTVAALGRRVSAALALAIVTGVTPLVFLILADAPLRTAYSRASRVTVTAAADAAALAVSQSMDDRRRATELLASIPDVVHAARVAAAEAKRRHLVGRSIAQLERQLDATRALSRDPRIVALLGLWQERYGFSDISITEVDGYAVLGTARAPDFVQSDEEWWQRALADGFSETMPQFDPTGRLTVDIAARIADPASHAPMGVLKATLPLGQFLPLLRSANDSSATLELIDAARRVIVSANASRLMRPYPGPLPPLGPTSISAPGESGRDIVAVASAHGHWWVVGRGTVTADGMDALRPLAYRAGAAGGLVMFVLVLWLGWRRRGNATA